MTEDQLFKPDGDLNHSCTPFPLCLPPLRAATHPSTRVHCYPLAMARRKVTTYAMLTLKGRLELIEEILAKSKARIAAGLPPDSPNPEEEEDAEAELEQDADMEDVQP